MTGANGDGSFRGYILVSCGFLIMLCMYGTLYSFGVFLKPMLTELAYPRASISGAYSLCFFLSGACAPFAGWLNDRLGPRPVLSCAGILAGSGYILASRGTDLPDFYLSIGLIVGLGMSGILVPALSTVARLFSSRRGLMTGTVISGVGTGTLVVPPIANISISAFDWRASFLGAGVIILVIVIGLAQLFGRDRGEKRAIPCNPDRENTAAGEGLSLHAALCTLQLWILFIIYVFCGFVIQVVLVHVPVYAISTGISSASAAALLSFIGAGSLAGRIAGGAASDFFGNRPVMMISTLVMASLFSLLFISGNACALFVFAGLFGVLYGEILCMMPLLPAAIFGLANHGAILGIITFASTLGGSLGPLTAGVMFDQAGDYTIVWILCAGLATAAFGLSAFLRQNHF